jgi:zinc protease
MSSKPPRTGLLSFGRAWTAALLTGWGVVTPLFAEAVPVRDLTLPNGMKVIVQEDHRSPVVVSQLWYAVGSADEVTGYTGVAHALEHMMFKGTREVPAGEFSRVIAAAGGRDNAFTSQDYTSYFQELQKSKLELALRMEADRMRNLIFSEKEFSQEIKVVMEERRLRTEDEPHALVYEQMMAAAFTVSPYRRPIIGWMTDLQDMTVADVKAWYEQWYAPNNAVLIVVGDAAPDEVFRLAERHFGPLKRRPLPQRKSQDEPAPLGIKRITVKAPAEYPYLAMAYHAPALRDPHKDWEPYALQVLSAVLAGSESARLPKALVRESEVATAVDAAYDGIRRGPGLFVVDGTPRAGKSAAEVETAIRAQLDALVQRGINAQELARVKAQVIAAQVFERDSMFYQAMQIGRLEMSRLSYRDIDTLLEKVKQVTAEQVQEVAKRYLQDDNLTVAVLDPQPLAGKPAQRPAAGADHERVH